MPGLYITLTHCFHCMLFTILLTVIAIIIIVNCTGIYHNYSRFISLRLVILITQELAIKEAKVVLEEEEMADV